MFLRSLHIYLLHVSVWEICIFIYSMYLVLLYSLLNVPEIYVWFSTLCSWYLCIFLDSMFLRSLYISQLYVPEIALYITLLYVPESSVYISTLWREGLRILSPVCACSHAEPWGACITFKDLPSTGSSKNMRHYWQIKSIIVFNQRGMHL